MAQAIKHLEDLELDLDAAAFESEDERTRKLLQAIEEFHAYVENNRDFIPNYGERYRHGEAISTAFVESTVNQVISKRMVKRQQMQWSQRGAHLPNPGAQRSVGADVSRMVSAVQGKDLQIASG